MTFFGAGCSQLETVTRVAKSIQFASFLTRLANKILAKMDKRGASEFNALHLRLEGDALAFVSDYGGKEVIHH